MIETPSPARRMVADVVYAYRWLQGRDHAPASLRAFCAALNESLTQFEMGIVHQTIKNWEDRRTLPDPVVIKALLVSTRDWRRDFAQDLLAALTPLEIEPATYIGQRARERSLIDTGPHKKRYSDWYRD
jgi:hypothetical protein